MKSTQLLSVVFSLIMFTGVSAGNVAFADEDLEDRLEFFCEMTSDEQSDFFSDYPELAEYDERLAAICDTEDEDDRYDSLEDLIDEVVLETRDEEDDYEDFDEEYDELEDEYDGMYDDAVDSFEDCVEAGFDVMESYPEQCMTDDGQVFVNDERYCEMSDEDKRDYLAEHDKTADHAQKMDIYCTLSESDRADFIADHRDEYKAHMKDRMYDKMSGNIDAKFREKLAQWCEMTDEEKADAAEKYDKSDEHVDRANSYCEMSDEDRADFIDEHRDEFKAHMKDIMHDKKKHHMNYDRLCAMAESDRAAEITDVAKLDRINNWCDMTPDEREDYKKNIMML